MTKRVIQQTVKGELVDTLVDVGTECECIIAKRRARLMQSSKITPNFQKHTFETFKTEGIPLPITEAYKKAKVYLKRFEDIRNDNSNGILLMGQPGCGKTHLLAATTNGLIAKNINVFYFPFVEGMEEIKADMSKEDVNKARIKEMQTADVLFIDDLFKPPAVPTTYEIRKMYEVINYRYLERLPIMISTEKTLGELVDIDEALGSRINEMCKEFRVEIGRDKELNWRLKSE